MINTDTSSLSSQTVADALRASLADAVRGALAHANGAFRIQTVSISVPHTIAPLRWLQAQPGTDRFFWSGRDDERVDAAVGCADVQHIDTRPLHPDAIATPLRRHLAAADVPIRYYGGLRFDAWQPTPPPHPDNAWAPFGTARFVLPRFTLRHTPAGSRLSCTLVYPRDTGRLDALLQQIDALVFPDPEPPAALPHPRHRTDVPTRDGWIQRVRWAVDAIHRERLEKVVFARRTALGLHRAPDPFQVLRHLRPATPGCFHVAMQPGRGPAFIGASPERLFRHDGVTVSTEALAGTGSRADSASADDALRDALLESDKDRREHAFVQRAIRRALEPLCSSVTADAVEEMRLARGRHLHAPLTGTLRSDVTPFDLLQALHPTPAVAGVPTDAALAAIRAREPFDRGWYAGPMGWIGPNAAEFTVAIRSGLIDDRNLALYSGAGLVDGSDPAKEWDEIEQKISDFAAILALSD
jgi:menaquinone-specific isochorismate synthase